MDTFTTQIRSIPQLSVNLRDARKAKGLTQSQLAQRTRIPRSWLSRMENGKIEDPSTQKILALFRELGITAIIQYPFSRSVSQPEQSRAAKSRANQSENNTKSATSHSAQAKSPTGEKTLAELAANGQRKAQAFLERMAEQTKK
ncbi:helix-turn-helix transcriptional regulator [Bifidobacterium sp. ESL0763]|uniref:helix-turn-helix domain-containing protein n=1 Tax=Bifidobacterium sp. ESL0763 TaxID=2983227 RepID=UPI0023F84BB8|nr:helix-turn-helix transcriptional regulator [Bifidobacterium sp. ESL0763]MDF7664421.1 helix-turn-helix transcriptional regulator [Bifidobacterium sp. ESL0763]